MDCGKILDVSMHLLPFSHTIIKRVLALLLLMLQRTRLLPSPELKWIGSYRQMCPPQTYERGEQPKPLELTENDSGPMACKIWHNMQHRINTTTKPLWKLKMSYKNVIYRYGFQKGIFLCHINIIFNIIRKCHHYLMFPFEHDVNI